MPDLDCGGAGQKRRHQLPDSISHVLSSAQSASALQVTQDGGEDDSAGKKQANRPGPCCKHALPMFISCACAFPF